MPSVRTFASIAALSSAAIATSTWAAAADQHDSHHPAPATATQVAQAQPGSPGMGAGMRAGAMSPGYPDQMKAMQQMHDKMVAAKTPEERNALMAEQMKLMQSGMNMMGGMGAGAAAGKPADMAARQGMLEQRMDIMQSMMQMMVDRVQSVPATK